jgi:AcrR family transcriptional regulator
MESRTRQAQRTEATKARLLSVARQMFVEHGFANVPAEELVQQAGLTRGALYHQFGGKEGLFAALYEIIQQEVTARINAAAEQAPDAWSGLRIGCHAFLQACVDPEVQRIMLLDAPVVLSWERWRAVDAQYGLGSLKQGLQYAMERGFIAEQPIDPLAHLLVGAMNEAAMWIARAPAPEEALRQAIVALDALLDGLRVSAGRAT